MAWSETSLACVEWSHMCFVSNYFWPAAYQRNPAALPKIKRRGSLKMSNVFHFTGKLLRTKEEREREREDFFSIFLKSFTWNRMFIKTRWLPDNEAGWKIIRLSIHLSVKKQMRAYYQNSFSLFIYWDSLIIEFARHRCKICGRLFVSARPWRSALWLDVDFLLFVKKPSVFSLWFLTRRRQKVISYETSNNTHHRPRNEREWRRLITVRVRTPGTGRG